MFLSSHHQTSKPDTMLLFYDHASVTHAVSDGFFSQKEIGVFIFCSFFPLNRLLVYEGSLYRLKCIVK